MYRKLFDAIEGYKDVILKAERDLNSMPELGFREWKTHAYMKARFEELGYELTELGNIPGFYTDVATCRPGPKIVVFAELDGLPCPGHPFADPETNAGCGICVVLVRLNLPDIPLLTAKLCRHTAQDLRAGVVYIGRVKFPQLV